MQGNTGNGTRKPASTPKYISPNQLILEGFETPFEQKLSKDNRWVKLGNAIPWDSIVNSELLTFRSLACGIFKPFCLIH